jgi:hypothetical protein
VEEPLIKDDPVRIKVSIPENIELPKTSSDPLTMAPLDAVTDARCASLPLTIILFQLANYYSIKILDAVRISIPINMNFSPFWSDYKPNCDLSEL